MIPTMPKPFTHMTVIPDRLPEQKAHTNIGHAKAAVSQRLAWGRGIARDVQVYELKDGEWTLLWDIPAGSKRDDFPWNKKDK